MKLKFKTQPWQTNAVDNIKPVRVVFRDHGFSSDAVKINVEQIFHRLSPATEVKSI